MISSSSLRGPSPATDSIPENEAFDPSLSPNNDANKLNDERGVFGASTKPRSLSLISAQYDTSGKGYLTPAEQHMRQMDTDGQGRLTNEQVSKIVEETMALKDTNKRLQFWVCALFGAVVILALSSLGTSFAAAILAKDTSVDSTSGEMTVKGSGGQTTVVTISKGKSMTLPVYYDENGNSFSCLDIVTLGLVMNSTMEGVRNSFILESSEEDGGSVETVGFVAGGTGWNTQRACLGTTMGSFRMCATFGDDRCAKRQGRRLQVGAAQSQARQLRDIVRRKLDPCYTNPDDVVCSDGSEPTRDATFGCYFCWEGAVIVFTGQTQGT